MTTRWTEWRQERRLVARLRRQLAAMDITEPIEMDEVCRRLAVQRGKPMRLLPWELGANEAFGLWLSTSSADYVVYQKMTTRHHQRHIIAHEIGHIMCGHQSDILDDAVLQDLVPGADPDVVRSLLRRTSYDSAQEREAETAASLLLEEAATAGQVALPSASPRARRMQATLAGRRWL